MSEGMHSSGVSREPTVKSSGMRAISFSGWRGKRLAVALVGTAALLVVGGVLVQVMRPTSAYPDAGAGDAAGQATVGESKSTRKMIAKVGKKFITYDELATECVARHGQEILDNLINRSIIQQACEQYGIEVTEAEVDAEILKIAKKFSLAVDQWMQMLQAERGLTPAQYRRDIIWPMLALRKLAGEQVTISKEDLQKAFERNYGVRVKARAIVLDNPRRANEVWEKARANPEEFGRLARMHSVDPSSRPLEGAVPPIRKFGGSPQIEAAAFKLQPGEVSGVIQVGDRQWVILLCEGHTEQIVQEMSEVEAILKQELHDEKVNEAVAKVFEKVKAEARVDNYLTGVSSGGERKTVKDKQIQPVGGTAAQPSKKLPARVSNSPAKTVTQ